MAETSLNAEELYNEAIILYEKENIEALEKIYLPLKAPKTKYLIISVIACLNLTEQTRLLNIG